jgi:hypothetical protein
VKYLHQITTSRPPLFMTFHSLVVLDETHLLGAGDESGGSANGAVCGLLRPVLRDERAQTQQIPQQIQQTRRAKKVRTCKKKKPSIHITHSSHLCFEPFFSVSHRTKSVCNFKNRAVAENPRRNVKFSSQANHSFSPKQNQAC